MDQDQESKTPSGGEGDEPTPERQAKAGENGEVDPNATADRDALAEDLRTMLSLVESIHAEPYHGYDGRIALHRAFESAVRELPRTENVEAFYRRAAPLIAGLDDTHSKLVPPDRQTDDRRLPLSFRVVGSSLYVKELYEESLADLLGGRLRSVAGEPVDAMADRGASLRGAENRYAAVRHLGRSLAEYDAIDRLLGETTAPAAPTITVEAPDGTERTRSVDPIPTDRTPVRTLDSTVASPSGSGPRYRLYENGEGAMFIPGDLTGYREVIEGARDRGAAYAESIARDAYEQHVGEDPPTDLDELTAALPSMVETLTALVRAMADAGTEALVVDLRDNPGGDSRFLQQLGYVLFGVDTVVEATDWAIAVKRRTEAHRDEYGVPETARDAHGTFEDNPADYDFRSVFRLAEADHDTRVEEFEANFGVGTFDAELDTREHEKYYTPDRIVVVTSAATMSSAFAGAALLSELGVDVVGVPSGQAPVSFGEAIDRTLPNTGLTVELSGSMYRWVPDPSGTVLSMDRELTPEHFEERYDRANDAALRLAFEHAGIVAPGDRPDPC